MHSLQGNSVVLCIIGLTCSFCFISMPGLSLLRWKHWIVDYYLLFICYGNVVCQLSRLALIIVGNLLLACINFFGGNPIHENIMTRNKKTRKFTTRKFPDIRYMVSILISCVKDKLWQIFGC